MKQIKIILLVVLLLFLVWIDLPEIRLFNLNLGPPHIQLTTPGFAIDKDFKTHLGLDLKGGSHLVFETDVSKVKTEDRKDALSSARDIIEKRVNFFGLTEPVVQTVKSGKNYRVSVDLPGVENVKEAVALIGQTAQLSFREEASGEAKIATGESVLSRLTKDTGITGKHVKKASVVFDQQTGKPQVALTFTSEGSERFAQTTKRNIGKPIAIYLDRFIISAPVVQQEITGGQAVITGSFKTNDAKQLAVAINSGALPVPIRLIEVRNVGPTLGEAEVRKSVVAGFFGLMMVLLFMVAYYGRLGLIASLALIIYGFISLAIFRIIPIVLTLPGIAGFILSIGMAVDANILIFERIKEESRKGNDLKTAIQVGFGRAIDAIKDANITTIIVAFILFNPLNWEFLPQFGLVRGFAVTLFIGVVTSLFTGVVITRRLINLFYRS